MRSTTIQASKTPPSVLMRLFSNTGTEGNTAIGWEALASNTTGSFNTAIGWAALVANTTGGSNTAVGVTALDFNTTGFGNIAIGGSALALNQNRQLQHGHRFVCSLQQQPWQRQHGNRD